MLPPAAPVSATVPDCRNLNAMQLLHLCQALMHLNRAGCEMRHTGNHCKCIGAAKKLSHGSRRHPNCVRVSRV